MIYRDREAHRGVGAASATFRPVASPEDIKHLLAAIDATAAMALREVRAVELQS